MPASRTSDAAKLQTHMDRLSLHTAVGTRNMPAASTPPKKKKAPNAFIMFRSYAIAERLLPNDITHQNDVSRAVALLWREQSAEIREHFQSLAEATKLRMQLEGTIAESQTRNKRKTSTKRSRSSLSHQTKIASYIPTPPLTPELVRDSPEATLDELHSPVLRSQSLVKHKAQVPVQSDHQKQGTRSWAHAWDSSSFQWMADEYTSSLSLGSWSSNCGPFTIPYAPNLNELKIDWDAILTDMEVANLDISTF